MPLAALGVVDLSSITDQLISILNQCRNRSALWNPKGLAVNPGPPFTIHITGSSPEAVRNLGDCQLTMCLFHAVEDKFQKNLPPLGQTDPAVPAIRYTPLSLDLYYLLTAFAKGNYVHEQQAMTVAMRCLHDNPIIKMNVTLGANVVAEEFTLAMEAESSDELARLWQSFAVPPRLSAVYKLSVALISPEAGIGPAAPMPTHVSVTADATKVPFSTGGQVTGTSRVLQFHTLAGTLSDPIDLAPATAVPNQNFVLEGDGLNEATSNHIYLTMPGAVPVEKDVTAWLAAPPVVQTSSKLTLLLPNKIGVPPAASPKPGIYQLCVGDAGILRTNSTPFSIAPRVNVTKNPPLLTGPNYTINGLGFTAGKTQVLLDTIALAEGATGPGFYQVNGAGTQIKFRAPKLPAGFYSVRIRVNQVEADPAWWIRIV